jgi:hypothetical protein
MNVGLPGTGIGGLFYLLLAVLMPLHELWKTARGRSSVQGWSTAARQSSVAVAILAALWGEGWLIKRGWAWASARSGFQGVLSHLSSRGPLFPDNSHLIALASVMTLVAVLLFVHGAGAFLGLRPSKSPKPE